MNSVLGSQFDVSLRVLLLLQAAGDEVLTEGAIAALDFISVYSRDFGITKSNLHGDNRYRFGEFAARRNTIKTAIKQLVLDGLITASRSDGGFLYSLSCDGVEFIAGLDCEYADAYYDTTTRVMASVGKSEHILSKMINQQSIASIRGR